MADDLVPWLGFLVFLVFSLYVDFKYGGSGVPAEKGEDTARKKHVNSHRFKVAMLWTLAWIVLAGVFAFGIYLWIDWESCLVFMTAYMLEKSLSLDNVFVFLVLFNTMKTPAHLQPDVLNWGIILALVFRAIFILAGTLLLQMFAWIMPMLGLFLIFTGVKMLWVGEEDDLDLDSNPQDDEDFEGNFVNRAGDNFLVKLIAKAMPVSNKYDADGRMFVKRPKENGSWLPSTFGGEDAKAVWHATPQLIVLVALAASDVVFAMDSIPAILSITTDNFLVITSNCFAVLGLRSLFFVLAALQSMFKYLQQALALILAAVGFKMVLGYFEVHISVTATMIFMSVVLTGAVVLSMYDGNVGSQHWDVDNKLMEIGHDSFGSPIHANSNQHGEWLHSSGERSPRSGKANETVTSTMSHEAPPMYSSSTRRGSVSQMPMNGDGASQPVSYYGGSSSPFGANELFQRQGGGGASGSWANNTRSQPEHPNLNFSNSSGKRLVFSDEVGGGGDDSSSMV